MRRSRDPWRHARVGEQHDQLLPRWFVLLAIAAVVAAALTAAAAFVLYRPAQVPVAARRPPPAGGLTTAVGARNVGDSRPVVYRDACRMLAGVRVAGSPADPQLLRRGLAGLCNTGLPDDVAERLRRFAARGGVVRFAQFEATGVDSTARLDADPPVVLVNARFARTDPLWIAPLVVHDTTFLDRDPARAESALAARRAEAFVCERLLAGRRPSRGCTDAQALLAPPDPLAALRNAGFR